MSGFSSKGTYPVMGTLGAAGLGMAPSPNWAITDFEATAYGSLRVININLIYGGTTVTAGADGDISDINPFTGNLPAGWLPGTGIAANGVRIGQHGGTAIMSTDGQISLIGMNSNSTLVSGNAVYIGFVYAANA